MQIAAFVGFECCNSTDITEALHGDGQGAARMIKCSLDKWIRAAGEPAALFFDKIIQQIAECEIDALACRFSAAKRSTVHNALACKAAEIGLAGMDALVLGHHPVHFTLACTHVRRRNILIRTKNIAKILHVFFTDQVELLGGIIARINNNSALASSVWHLMQSILKRH
ncbi:hypothetical protein D3C78_1310990 [compost metagenome]